MANPILNFQFSLEPGMGDSEIETLYQNAKEAQMALDRFLAGEFSEQEMTDLLSMCEVDLDETREIMDSNAQALGLIQL